MAADNPPPVVPQTSYPPRTATQGLRQRWSASTPPPKIQLEHLKPQIQLEDVHEEQYWVVVFGYRRDNADYVLNMFQRYGVVLKHVPGPRDANWVHIQYETRSGAERALSKNGVQINRVVMIGVNPVDATQHQALNEKAKPLPPSTEMTILDWVFGNPLSSDWVRKVNRSTPGLR